MLNINDDFWDNDGEASDGYIIHRGQGDNDFEVQINFDEDDCELFSIVITENDEIVFEEDVEGYDNLMFILEDYNVYGITLLKLLEFRDLWLETL